MAAKKKPMGRKMKQVAVYMTPAQIKKVQQAARAGRETFSDYVRRLCGVKDIQ